MNKGRKYLSGSIVQYNITFNHVKRDGHITKRYSVLKVARISQKIVRRKLAVLFCSNFRSAWNFVFFRKFHHLFLYDIKLHKLVICYHGKEESKLWIQWNDITICEHKLLLSFFLRHQHNVDLLSGYRQHWQFNAVELVEAPPTSWLRQSWWTSEGDREKKNISLTLTSWKTRTFHFISLWHQEPTNLQEKSSNTSGSLRAKKVVQQFSFYQNTLLAVTVYKWWGVSDGIFSYVLKIPPLEI